MFDEFRYFVPGNTLPVFRVPAADGESVDVAIAICEDLWQDGGPVAVCRRSGAGLLVVPNASPYERGKDDVRLDLVVRRAREAGAALAYANMIGGQDELVFDGDSILVNADGTLLARGPQFEEALVVADLDLPAAPAGEVPGEQPVDAEDGTVITIKRVTLPDAGAGRGHGRRTPGEAVLAAAAGPGRGVRGAGHRGPGLRAQERVPVGHPGAVRRHRLGADRDDRRRRDRPGQRARGADAEPVLLGALGQRRRGPGQAAGRARGDDPDRRDGGRVRRGAHPGRVPETGLPAENLQARVRGVILMGLSNAAGHLVLTTGNKSELATGYSTLYGDSAGGFGPIKDVFKTMVWELARWRNAEAAGGD